MTRTPWTLATEKVLDIVAVTSFNRADLASPNPCYRPRFQLSASVNVVMVASMVRLLSIRVAPYWRSVGRYQGWWGHSVLVAVLATSKPVLTGGARRSP